VMVRFGRDELPFSPGDLTMPVRQAKPAGRPPGRPAAREEPAVAGPPLLPPAPTKPAAREPAAKEPTPVEPVAGENAAVAAGRAMEGRKVTEHKREARDTVPAQTAAGGDDVRVAGAEAAPAKPAARKGRAKQPADLVVTLTWQEGEWTVQASRGSRVVVKPATVRAAEALKMVSFLDTPAVQAAVEEIVAAARAEAQERAERLRRELAEAEARLAELD